MDRRNFIETAAMAAEGSCCHQPDSNSMQNQSRTGKKHHQMNMKETEKALGTWAWDAGIDTRGDWEHTME